MGPHVKRRAMMNAWGVTTDRHAGLLLLVLTCAEVCSTWPVVVYLCRRRRRHRHRQQASAARAARAARAERAERLDRSVLIVGSMRNMFSYLGTMLGQDNMMTLFLCKIYVFLLHCKMILLLYKEKMPSPCNG